MRELRTVMRLATSILLLSLLKPIDETQAGYFRLLPWSLLARHAWPSECWGFRPGALGCFRDAFGTGFRYPLAWPATFLAAGTSVLFRCAPPTPVIDVLSGNTCISPHLSHSIDLIFQGFRASLHTINWLSNVVDLMLQTEPDVGWLGGGREGNLKLLSVVT